MFPFCVVFYHCSECVKIAHFLIYCTHQSKKSFPLNFIFRSREGSGKKDRNAVKKRFFMVLALGFVAFLTLLIIFSQLGHNATEGDPFLDPLNNPNIRVEPPKIIETNG